MANANNTTLSPHDDVFQLVNGPILDALMASEKAKGILATVTLSTNDLDCDSDIRHALWATLDILNGLVDILQETTNTSAQTAPLAISDDSQKQTEQGWKGVCRVAAEAIRDCVAIGEEAPLQVTKHIQERYRHACKTARMAISEIESFPDNASSSAVVHLSAVKAVAESISLIEPNGQAMDFASIESIIFNSLSLAEELADSAPSASNFPEEIIPSSGGLADEN